MAKAEKSFVWVMEVGGPIVAAFLLGWFLHP